MKLVCNCEGEPMKSRTITKPTPSTAVLHLTLNRQFFDAIAEGRKTREYRDDKPYWRIRLAGRKYDEVIFRNGYLTDVPWMRVKCLGIRAGAGRFVIRLGKILEKRNHRIPISLRYYRYRSLVFFRLFLFRSLSEAALQTATYVLPLCEPWRTN